MGLLPGFLFLDDFLHQYFLKRLLCQSITVSGLTMIKVSAQLDQVLLNATQNERSISESLGLMFLVLKAANCWRRARFSVIK